MNKTKCKSRTVCGWGNLRLKLIVFFVFLPVGLPLDAEVPYGCKRAPFINNFMFSGVYAQLCPLDFENHKDDNERVHFHFLFILFVHSLSVFLWSVSMGPLSI